MRIRIGGGFWVPPRIGLEDGLWRILGGGRAVGCQRAEFTLFHRCAYVGICFGDGLGGDDQGRLGRRLGIRFQLGLRIGGELGSRLGNWLWTAGSESGCGFEYSFRAGWGSNLEADSGSGIKGVLLNYLLFTHAFWLVITYNHLSGQKVDFWMANQHQEGG